MFRSFRRCTLAGTLLAIVAVAPLAAASAAFAAPDRVHAQGSDPVLATLRVTTDNVEVKKDGADKFEAAKDGDKLRQGDTVRTDATGTAEVDYTDDSYTRLDVNTTFKIKKLTNDQGARQTQGSLEVGQTWNRTAALSESGSFEQEGAGANATVRGTAFSMSCDTVDHCVFTAIVDAFDLQGKDGTSKLLSPLDECDAASGDLCPEITKLTIAELPSWVITNLKLDKSERGIDDSGFLPTAAIAADSPTLVIEQQAGSVIDGCSLSITGLIAPGSDVTLNGSQFDPTETLPVSLNGTVVQEVTTDAAGAFTTQLSIPGDTTFPIVISVPCGPGSSEVASATASLDPGQSSAALAFTGSDSSPLLAGGLVALAVGAILVVGARRRAGVRAS
jgi:hypothetical protein